MLKDSLNQKKEQKTDKKNVWTTVFTIIVISFLFLKFFSETDFDMSSLNNFNGDLKENNNLEIINKINNNYSIKLTKINQNSDNNILLEFHTDGEIGFYEFKIKDEVRAFLEYDDSIFEINSDASGAKKAEKNMANEYFHKELYELSFIRDLVDKSKKIKEEKYELSLSAFFDEYNRKYNSNYESIGEEKITIEIKNNGYTFIIDYSSINNIIFKSQEKLEYKIEFFNIDKNDFKGVLEYLGIEKKD